MMSNAQPQICRALIARIAGVVGALAVFVSSCSEPTESVSDGSNTNWLLQCTESTECGLDTSCTCGVCSKRCETNAGCGSLARARCAEQADAAWLSTCSATPDGTSGVCLPACEAGTCEPGQACVSGACAFVSPPNTAFCAGSDAAEPDSRRRADELLDAIQAVRVAGGVSCGTDAPSEPGVPLRLDARVFCAAAVHAAEMNATRVLSLIDSEGRDTEARLDAAGYTADFWAEGFALSNQSASAALDIMLDDRDACRGLTAPNTTDAGVASVGDAWVIVLGAE
jgi:hypothetical protein